MQVSWFVLDHRTRVLDKRPSVSCLLLHQAIMLLVKIRRWMKSG